MLLGYVCYFYDVCGIYDSVSICVSTIEHEIVRLATHNIICNLYDVCGIHFTVTVGITLSD